MSEMANKSGDNQGRKLYVTAGVIALLVVFAGFARSFYLKPIFQIPPTLTLMLWAHGLVMSGWVVLFIVQAALVSMKKTPLHRKIGTLGAMLAGCMVALGLIASIISIKEGHTPGPPPLQFLAIPFFDMLVFGILSSVGLYFTHKIEIHKRLMLLANLGILGAAFARIPIDALQKAGPLAYFGLVDLFIIACIVIDTRKYGRLHPAFGWGALLVIISHPLRLVVMGTDLWLKFAHFLVS